MTPSFSPKRAAQCELQSTTLACRAAGPPMPSVSTKNCTPLNYWPGGHIAGKQEARNQTNTSHCNAGLPWWAPLATAPRPSTTGPSC